MLMRKEKLIGRAFGSRGCYRTSRLAAGAAVAAALVAAPEVSHAEPGVRELSLDKTVSWSIAAGGGAVWIGSELAKSSLAPEGCRWCDTVPGVDRQVRQAWRWENTSAADDASDVLDFAVLPALVLGGDALLASQHGALRGWDEDAVVIVEAVVIASLLNQVVKFSVGRERPFVHALETDEEKRATEHPHDNDLSFYSGHTSLAFALVGAGGTVAQMRGYRHGWLVWPVGGVLAATVGYLRIGADKHWFTDVATGAFVGGAIGVAAPYLLHAPKDDDDESGSGSGLTAAGAAMAGPLVVVSFAF